MSSSTTGRPTQSPGVKAVGADGAQYQINAKAVVLATGGFAGNGEMQKEYLSDEYWPLKGVWGTYGYGMTQNDGKMIQSAIDIGAGTYNIDMPPMVHFVTTTQILTEYPVNMIEGKVDNRYGYEATWSLNDVPMTMAISQNVLQVDVHGDRYANEAETFVWWKAGPTFFSIWSDAQVKEVQKNGFSVVKTTMAQGQGGVPVGPAHPRDLRCAGVGCQGGIRLQGGHPQRAGRQDRHGSCQAGEVGRRLQ